MVQLLFRLPKKTTFEKSFGCTQNFPFSPLRLLSRYLPMAAAPIFASLVYLFTLTSQWTGRFIFLTTYTVAGACCLDCTLICKIALFQKASEEKNLSVDKFAKKAGSHKRAFHFSSYT